LLLWIWGTWSSGFLQNYWGIMRIDRSLRCLIYHWILFLEFNWLLNFLAHCVYKLRILLKALCFEHTWTFFNDQFAEFHCQMHWTPRIAYCNCLLEDLIHKYFSSLSVFYFSCLSNLLPVYSSDILKPIWNIFGWET
jgi:hypothetical protein